MTEVFVVMTGYGHHIRYHALNFHRYIVDQIFTISDGRNTEDSNVSAAGFSAVSRPLHFW